MLFRSCAVHRGPGDGLLSSARLHRLRRLAQVDDRPDPAPPAEARWLIGEVRRFVGFHLQQHVRTAGWVEEILGGTAEQG